MSDLDVKKLEQKLKGIKAKDLMSRFAITIKDNETATNLAHLMMRFKISGVPVIDKNGDIHGIVTATDLFNLMKSIIKDMDSQASLESYADKRVNDLMTEDAVTITEETNLFEMMKIMCEHNIHTLPVMGLSKKDIVGVIGRRDIVNAVFCRD